MLQELQQFKDYATEFPNDGLGLCAMAVYLWPLVASENNFEPKCTVARFRKNINTVFATEIFSNSNFNRSFKNCIERGDGIVSVDENGDMTINMEKRSLISINNFIKMVRNGRPRSYRASEKSTTYNKVKKSIKHTIQKLVEKEKEATGKISLRLKEDNEPYMQLCLTAQSLLYTLLSDPNINFKLLTHGGRRIDGGLKNNREEDSLYILGKYLGKSRSTISTLLNHCKYLSSNTIQYFIDCYAPKDFFNSVQTRKSELCKQLESQNLEMIQISKQVSDFLIKEFDLYVVVKQDEEKNIKEKSIYNDDFAIEFFREAHRNPVSNMRIIVHTDRRALEFIYPITEEGGNE